MSSIDETWSESSGDYHDEFFKSLLSFMDESDSDADETSGYESMTSENSELIPSGYLQHFTEATEQAHERIPIYKQSDKLPKPQISWSYSSKGCIFSVKEHPTRQVISCANSILTQQEPIFFTQAEVYSTRKQPSCVTQKENDAQDSDFYDSVLSRHTEESVYFSNFNGANESIDNETFDASNWRYARSSTPLRGGSCHKLPEITSFNSNDSQTIRLKTELFIMLLKNKNLPELSNHPTIASRMGSRWRGSSELFIKSTTPSSTKTYSCASDDSFTSATPTHLSNCSSDKENRNPNLFETTCKRTSSTSRCYPLAGSFCKFCFKNGETEQVYNSHVLRAKDGTVACPVLQKYTCEICGATGQNSHTRKYCLKFSENQSEGGNKPTYRRLSNGFWTQNLFHK